MNDELPAALGRRHSYYAIGPDSPIDDRQIGKLAETALALSPSAFNSQSGRIVLLFGTGHKRLWDMILEALRARVPADKFGQTEKKIAAFAAGHGSVMFYDDWAAVEKLQRDMPSYKDAFPTYAAHAAGMLQFVVWTLFRDAGLGASLQHYGNLIEAEASRAWNIPASWRLVAQMPFGSIQSEPGAKQKLPASETLRIID
ncbi:MAG: nitroreductase family protein [Planctomycetota bacterium]|nr:nitroreductase family protein [Planctomycetota bacterium]